jgi:hypothetical protein
MRPNEVVREALGRHLVIYIGVPGSSIVYSLLVLVFLAGAAGTLLLVPSLISRIPGNGCGELSAGHWHWRPLRPHRSLV